MPRLPKRAVLLTFCIMAIGVAWLLNRTERLKPLPDGTIMGMEAVTSGTNVFYESFQLQRMIHPWFASNVLSRFGIKVSRGIVVEPTWHDGLTAWLRIFHPDMGKPELAKTWERSRHRIIALGPDGVEWENRSFSLQSYQLDSALLIIPLTAYPRAEEAFKLRLLRQDDSKAWRIIGEFPVRNPQPTAKPLQNWHPDQLPATKSIHGLDVILEGLYVTQNVEDSSHDVQLRLSLGTCPENLRWQIKKCVIRDSLGNIQEDFGGIIQSNQVTLAGRYPLNPNDIWKVELKLQRQTNDTSQPKVFRTTKVWVDDLGGTIDFYAQPISIPAAP